MDSAFLLNCKRGIRPPVEFRQVLGLFLEVQQGIQTSILVVRGYLGFISSQFMGIRPYLELKGNSVSFRVPLKFQ